MENKFDFEFNGSMYHGFTQSEIDSFLASQGIPKEQIQIHPALEVDYESIEELNP